MQALADCKKDDRLDDSAVEINSDDESQAEARLYKLIIKLYILN